MTSRHADVIVIGAGVFGLHTALAILRKGRSVLVLEQADCVGADASGGIVGALAPHMPERWTAKKQFQLDALLELGPLMHALEASTGMTTGYGSTGRISPIQNENMRERARERSVDAMQNWPSDKMMTVLPGDSWPRWLTPEAAPFGMVHDTLSARLHPRRTIEALAAAVTAEGGDILYGQSVHTVTPTGNVTSAQSAFSADHVVIANGVAAFSLIEPHVGELSGRGEKGQALLLNFDIGDLPVIQGDGLYIVPHTDGTIAIGSTSERVYKNGQTTDELLDNLHHKALTMAPRLGRAEVILRWAGERPRANGRDPMIGPLPGLSRLHAMTGGFKIGFGVAHRCAQIVAATITDSEGPALPETFAVSAHLGQA